jgi:phosphoribosylanthranilate isomerase
MGLKFTVKVSHLSNLSDARFCSGMGVDLLGFGAIPGAEHYMPDAVFQEIRGWLAGPRIVTELYGIESPTAIEQVMSTYAPDFVELSIEAYMEMRDALPVQAIVAVSADSIRILPDRDEKIAYVIADESMQCKDITNVNYPVLIRVTSPDQLHSKIESGCFHGYVVDAPKQTKAGITSYDELGIILETLEED